MDELKKVKHVIHYGVFAAYHLALETSFLADEGASLPQLPLNAPITVALPEKPSSTIERSISTIPGFTIPDNERTPGPEFLGEPQRSNSVPTSDLFKVTIASIGGGNEESSGLPAPMSSQYTERPASSSAESFQFSSLNEFYPHHVPEERDLVDLAMTLEVKSSEADRSSARGDCLISSDIGDPNIKIMEAVSSAFGANKSVSDPSSLQLHEKQIIEEQTALEDNFPPSPSDHQSILVSLSSRCVWKGTVCERSHRFRIKYYGNFDKPLGRFLRDHLFDQVPLSPSLFCKEDYESFCHICCYE